MAEPAGFSVSAPPPPASAAPRAPEPGAAIAWVGMVVSVAGSLLGTWVTGQLDGSPTQKLAGAVLGAVVPALLTEALSKGRTRPAVALVVAVLAIALTYVTLTGSSYATQTPSEFPLPPGVDSPTGAEKEVRDGVGIEHTPTYLECTAHGCSEPVRVSNAGTVPLEVTDIEVEGPDAASFRADPDGACAHHTLPQPGDECSFDVVYTPSGHAEREAATVVVHQNLPGDATRIPVSGEGHGDGGTGSGGETDPAAPFELELGTEVQCVHQRGGTADGADALQLFLSLRLVQGEADALPGLVGVSAVSDSGASWHGSTAVGSAAVVAQLGLGDADYAREHLVTVTADAGNEVREVDEGNNRIVVQVRVPERPVESTTPLSPCSASRG